MEPWLAQWTTKDRSRFGGGLNFYAYCYGDPINFVDRTGRVPEPSDAGDPEHPYGGGGAGGFGQTLDAINDFLGNYFDMREANTIGADKYFHCLANCQAAEEGGNGEFTSRVISESREQIDEHIKRDPRSACDADRAANDHGRSGGRSGGDCREVCSGFRPRGLHEGY
jgi:hypothetical protein